MSIEPQTKQTDTTEITDDERHTDRPIRETSTTDIADDERRTDRPTSTAEVAKDLQRPEHGDRPDDAAEPLFPENETNDFRKRWGEIQTGFVDEPRHSVEQADALVAEVIKRLANSFAEARSRLEGQWGRGDNVSTEDLRIALRRYRSFFDRLLNV
jgi:hypothetical protein